MLIDVSQNLQGALVNSSTNRSRAFNMEKNQICTRVLYTYSPHCQVGNGILYYIYVLEISKWIMHVLIVASRRLVGNWLNKYTNPSWAFCRKK